MVKVLSTLLCLPGFETQIQNDKTGKRSAPKRRSTREQREGQGEGPRTVETWYVSRDYDLRTEVWRGCTPKVPKFNGGGVPNLFPSHGLFGLVRGTLG